MGDPFLFQRDLSGARPLAAGTPLGCVRTPADGALEPVTVDEARKHIGLTSQDDDALLQDLMEAAREALEEATGLALVRQTVVATFRGPAAWVDLPVRPIVAVESVERSAFEGSQAWTPAEVRLAGQRLQLLSRQALGHGGDLVTVTYTAGPPADWTSSSGGHAVPARLRRALLLWVADLYDHRNTVVVGASVTEIPGAVQALIGRERRFTV